MNQAIVPACLRMKTVYRILPHWLVALLVLMGGLVFFDLGYYLRLGEIILEQRTIPNQDLFTHTFAGLHYVNSGWLSQVLLALTHRAGGLELLLVLQTLLIGLGMGILFEHVRRATGSAMVTLLFGVVAILLGISNWGLRPQLFILPLFAVFVSTLSQPGALSFGRIVLLVGLMALWVNLHSSFVLGLGLVGIHLVGRTLDRITAGDRLRALGKDPVLRRLLLLLILLLPITLLNPFGIEIWAEVWANSSVSRGRVSEWQPTTMRGLPGIAFGGSVVLTALLLGTSRRRLDWTEGLLLAVFMLAGFSSLRLVLWWSMVSAPILARHFMALPCMQRRSKRSDTDAGNESPLINASLLLALVLGVVLMLPWLRPWHPVPEARELVDGKLEPVALVNHIEQSGYQGPMYNNLNWGSYLIYRLWPRYQVYSDNRLQIIPEEIWREVWDVHHGLGSWSRILDRRGVTWAVLGKKDNPRTVEFMRLDPGWVVDYEDDMGVIFVRAAAETATERLE